MSLRIIADNGLLLPFPPSILSAEALARIDEHGKGAPRKPASRYRQGQEIYAEGARSEHVYTVVSGVVRTCKFLSDGRRQVEAFYREGDVFGLEQGNERLFSAEAVSDCVLTSQRVNELDAEGHGRKSNLFEIAIETLSRSRAHMLLLGRHSAVEKVTAFLLSWGERCEAGMSFELPMTRQDIADHLGLTIETVSRTFTQLERKKLISMVGSRKIHMKDLDKLLDLVA